MKIKYILYSLVFVIAISSITSCKRHTCPTYATSGPTKHKKTKIKKKNAPWNKGKKMKKGKDVGVAPK